MSLQQKEVECHCNLIDERRTIKKKLRFFRQQKNKEFGERESTSFYTCARCRHHGVCVPKKFHAPCPYSNCSCEGCSLYNHLKLLDKQIAETKCNQMTSLNGTSSHVCRVPSADSEDGINVADSAAVSDVALELEALSTLLNNAINNCSAVVDYDALNRLFARETLDVSDEHALLIEQLAKVARDVMPSLLTPQIHTDSDTDSELS